MVFYEGAYPDFREDGMSLHISLWEKYTAIREDSVYKLQNVGIYDQFFSKSCSGEGVQYSRHYVDGMQWIVFK